MPRRVVRERSRPVAIMRPRTSTQNVVIANGESTSAAVDMTDGRWRLTGVQMSAAWDAASVTFEVSADGVAWSNLRYDGAEYTILAAGGAAAGLSFAVDPVALDGWPFVRVRSGVTGAFVNQGAARTLVVQLTAAGY